MKVGSILFSCINWKTSTSRLRNFPTEDKCKLDFDLHVCHQLLNIQARISLFLSAKAKEKIIKKTHTIKVNYETHHQRRPLDWTLYQALNIFCRKKFEPKRIPREEKVWFSADWETKEAKNVFLTQGWEFEFEYAWSLQVTWCFKVQLFLLPSAITSPAPSPTHSSCVFWFVQSGEHNTKIFFSFL